MTHEVLVDALVATTGLGIVVWAASVIARRSSAALRHTLWRIALAGFWLVPLALVTASVLDLDAYAVRVPILPTAEVTQSTEAIGPQGSGSLATGVPSSAPAASRETRPQQALTAGRIDVANWFLLLWVVGAAFGGACFVRNMYGVRRLLSQSSPADDPILTARASHWAAKIGLEKMPALAESETVVVPTVAGWRAPVILLPSGFSVSDAGSDAIIVHELAHIHRGDVATVWLARFTRTLWWWHPLVWLIAHQLRSSAEEACDNWAIALTERRKAYAGVLVHWAEVGASASNLACAYQGKALVRRVKRILTERRIPMLQLSSRTKAVLTVCAFCAVVAAGTLRVAPTQAESSAVTGQVLTRDELFQILHDETLETDAAVQTGQKVLSQYPPQLQMAGDRELAYNYALGTIAVAYQLAERQRKCQEALGVTGPYLAVFGRTPVDMGCAVDTLHLRCLLRTRAPAGQMLQAARTSAQRALGIPNLPNVGGVSLWATSEGGLINSIFDCYVRAGRPQEAMDWFQRLPLFHPDLVSNLNYWEKLTDTYLQHHQPEKAIQAAVLCFRTC
ncbi:MAG: M56 family metallopeptidase, partial [Armatimonadetes bacterium]|nr:M56 family metallopeptidase [Armatimonadota bacterium]